MRITVLANPKRFLDLSRILMPWVCGAAFLLLAAGFYWALFDTPPDYQQGQSVKIMFVHVPAAYMGIMIYGVMAAASPPVKLGISARRVDAMLTMIETENTGPMTT